jgi:hypothetical protein
MARLGDGEPLGLEDLLHRLQSLFANQFGHFFSNGRLIELHIGNVKAPPACRNDQQECNPVYPVVPGSGTPATQHRHVAQLDGGLRDLRVLLPQAQRERGRQRGGWGCGACSGQKVGLWLG